MWWCFVELVALNNADKFCGMFFIAMIVWRDNAVMLACLVSYGNSYTLVFYKISALKTFVKLLGKYSWLSTFLVK